jgi:hypothetical protein
MAWVKLDDSMPHHPKIIAAGPEAFALDVAAICYSNRFGTDGHIAKHLLPHLLPGLQNVEHFASILLHVGRWIETENGYQIHDVLDYQLSSKHAKDVSVKRSAAGRKGGISSGKTREANGKHFASSKTKQLASSKTKPVPSRPVLSTNTLPEEENDVKPARKKDDIWDAVIEACGLNSDELTSSSRGAINKAVQQLKQVGATPDDIHERARQHLTRWSNVSLTPTSLAKNWAQLAAQPGKNKGGECRDCGQPKNQHDDEVCRMVAYR